MEHLTKDQTILLREKHIGYVYVYVFYNRTLFLSCENFIYFSYVQIGKINQ